ncbi:MAG TPA: triose-phosphate isomerase [Candidatus Paceibacterota bacterium]
MNKKKLIVANWKMNPLTVSEAVKIFDEIRLAAVKASGVQTVVCPPLVFIDALKKRTQGQRLRLGAQNVSSIKGTGAYTGEISAEQLLALGVSHVIVGHSERRALGDNNEIINDKLTLALKSGLNAILCVGEQSRDKDGDYLREIAKQIVVGLRKVQRRYLLNLTLAYEPLWAVGAESSGPASPEDVREMVIFIRKVIAEVAGHDLAHSVPILYGGSIDPRDATGFINKGGVDGLLIGRESLKPKHFLQIIDRVNAQNKKK